MKPQDLFGVILRSIAVWLCVWGGWNTLAGIKYLLPTIRALVSGTRNLHDSFGYFIYGIPAFLSGVIILSFAESFVRFTYPSTKPPPLPNPPVDPPKPETPTVV
jgi:hypothetical protein